MAIGIKDRLLFQLKINNMEVPLDQNTLDYFHMVESVRLHLPAMSLQIQDSTKFFSKNNLLVDGAPIQVTLGVEDKKLIFPMRYFTHKEMLSNGSPTFRIQAYLDVPKFWTSSTVKTITATASGALQDICNQTGLTYEGESTNDSQLWIPHNRRFTTYSKYIANQAFIDENSCLQLMVNTAKKMRLINVSNFEKMQIRQVFANMPGADQSIISDYRIINKSGFYNNVSGYKDQQVVQSNLADDQVYKDANVRKNTSKLMMSEAVRKAVGQNRVQHAPIDVGNVNANYQRGKYQNQRLANLFNSGLEIVTPKLCNAEVMEVINAQISRPGATGITAVSGKYMITSKVWYLTNNNFYQKLEVFRHGINVRSEQTQT